MGSSSVRTLFQQAYFVPDIARAVEQWVTAVGAGPFFLTPHHRADWFEYHGENVEADVSYAFGYAGDIQIQFIEQHDDTPSIYRDMFGADGSGHHHVASLVSDYAGERRRLVDAGFTIACELRANGAEAAYFDTRGEIGCYTEIHSDPERIVATFARWKQAHRAWDGVTDPLRSHVSGS
jgi:Glyoxalase/Bleomycin resistance protein/Dioxygenase superfamily